MFDNCKVSDYIAIVDFIFVNTAVESFLHISTYYNRIFTRRPIKKRSDSGGSRFEGPTLFGKDSIIYSLYPVIRPVSYSWKATPKKFRYYKSLTWYLMR